MKACSEAGTGNILRHRLSAASFSVPKTAVPVPLQMVSEGCGTLAQGLLRIRSGAHLVANKTVSLKKITWEDRSSVASRT